MDRRKRRRRLFRQPAMAMLPGSLRMTFSKKKCRPLRRPLRRPRPAGRNGRWQPRHVQHRPPFPPLRERLSCRRLLLTTEANQQRPKQETKSLARLPNRLTAKRNGTRGATRLQPRRLSARPRVGSSGKQKAARANRNVGATQRLGAKGNRKEKRNRREKRSQRVRV